MQSKQGKQYSNKPYSARSLILVQLATRLSLSQGWGNVQHDILHQVCDYLDATARWALRSVSAHWRNVSTQLAYQQLVIMCTIQRLSNKIAVLHYWRDIGKFCDRSVCCIVSAPVKLEDLARLLEHLIRQVESSALR